MPPIKPLFATVPTKMYEPGKPLFGSEAMVILDITNEEIAALNSDLTLSIEQVKAVQLAISKINMKSTNFSFIDDVDNGAQASLATFSDWTARAATGTLIYDTRAAMTRIHSMTARDEGTGIGGRFFRLISRHDEPAADVSREVDWLNLTANQRKVLATDIAARLNATGGVFIGLENGIAICRGLLSKGREYHLMVARAEPKLASLMLSVAICKQLLLQLNNLLAEMTQTEQDIKKIGLNLVPAWDVNRSLQP